jgi:hypothetical protein
MPDPITRPSFSEGQILAAADLQGTVDHAVGQLARHERYLHLWGIADGLGFTTQQKTATTGQSYAEITVAAGVAIDGTGREVVLGADTLLSETDFDASNVAVGTNPTDWFPVLLVGRDASSAASSVSGAGCGLTQSASISEVSIFQFGRPGQAATLDTQTASAVSDGPGNGVWQILLGYVQWDSTIGKFTAISASDQGVGVRYAGVQADEVVARGGTLTLRSQPRNVAGAPAVLMDPTSGGSLKFGIQNASGVVVPVFTVNAKGDVTAQGKISGGVTPGSVQVQSGTAMDGVVLPLPTGVTDAMVPAGSSALHVMLSPRLGGDPPSKPADTWASFTLDCHVDDSRRLSCMVRWYDLTAPANSVDLPGLCDYLVVVAVPASS